MINEGYAKKYCCEDVSNIENYALAIADTTKMWDCHHRRGTIYSKSDLIEIGEYYDRPAIELIFMQSKEHIALHKTIYNKIMFTGVKLSDAHKQAISQGLKGIKHGKLNDSHKQAISVAELNHPKKSKKILQFTKHYEFICEWPSTREIERKLGIPHNHISRCCKHKSKSAGGFIWEYTL